MAFHIYRIVTVLCILQAAVAQFGLPIPPIISSNPLSLNPEASWGNFKETFEKVYNGVDEIARETIFKRNIEEILQNNLDYDRGLRTFRSEINKFADMALNEFTKLMNGFKVGLRKIVNGLLFRLPENAVVPDRVDWREKGAVTPVQDQGACGSCWAFAATGSLEGQYILKKKNSVSLSEQHLIDCPRHEDATGCKGGSMTAAYEHIKENGGIDNDARYPYKAKEGECLYERSEATCSDFVLIPEGDENALKQAVATIGPVSTAVDANHNSFRFYKEGIYDEPLCSQAVTHGVLIVGYGTENNKDYWIVKNSWGADWGENGYIRMSRNKNNQCGIASYASYPIV
ncbi:cathepsin S [Caerostris extrusa]|uniref:Cathepsin S n=1 Tax=Caerostris extrusa TaxID=172846 RepID=A0AAV4M6Q2_CAEEX|nr:cathepsin S [Caerostris extrusa]